MADRPSNPAIDPTIAPVALAGTLASAGGGGVAPAAGSLRPGTVVAATYEITRLLGQGGMGAVWEAKHLRLPDKRVVVKVLLFGTTDPVTLARFRREAESRPTTSSSSRSTAATARRSFASHCRPGC